MTFTSYVLPGERLFPESIGYYPATGDFFVGSLLDGQLLRGNIASQQALPFLPAGSYGLNSAAGIKFDGQGRLFVAGASNMIGKIFVFDTTTGKLITTLSDTTTKTLFNDLAFVPNGEGFVTDSTNPVLYRITSDVEGNFSFEPWLSLTGTAITYQSGLNLNGITASHDGRYLIVGQTNTGKLFRIDTYSKEIGEIAFDSEPLQYCDGILLDGHTLYVVRNRENLLVTLDMSSDYLSGHVISSVSSPSFRFPTAVAKAGNSLLILNAQLNHMGLKRISRAT